MKVKLIKGTSTPSEDCAKCCFDTGSRLCVCPKEYPNCEGGYFVKIKTKPKRAGKYERLLKRVISSIMVWDMIEAVKGEWITEKQFGELKKIKESMK